MVKKSGKKKGRSKSKNKTKAKKMKAVLKVVPAPPNPKVQDLIAQNLKQKRCILFYFKFAEEESKDKAIQSMQEREREFKRKELEFKN